MVRDDGSVNGIIVGWRRRCRNGLGGKIYGIRRFRLREVYWIIRDLNWKSVIRF